MTDASATEEAAIDEALRESFPASDAPAWTGSHAGTPAPPERARTVREVVQTLREDARTLDLDSAHIEERFRALGLPVKRRPEDSVNVEAVILGQQSPARSIVVGAGLDSAPDVALLFALGRAFGASSPGRTLRLVALGTTTRYVDDLVRSGTKVDLMLGIEALGCGRLVRAIEPGWPSRLVRPGTRTCHHLSFVRHGIRGVMLTDAGPRRDCDFDRLGRIAQGLERIVARLVAA